MWVRTASERDLEEIRALLIATWHDTYDHIYGVEKVTEITDAWHSIAALRPRVDQPNSEFVVADTGEQICAVAFASSKDGRLVLLHQLYVSPDAQGKGAGSLLMHEIIDSFPEARKIRLEVEETNAQAIAFYENKGFVEVGRTANCGEAESGLPALILERVLG
ncbi:N-acetyltransferase family protein [Hoeflea sp.]|uniref:GNAT family N-acetyltransferase n=1 Tax=Hoeflea sp. TaxID=1940281 RepID=UPI003B01B463